MESQLFGIWCLPPACDYLHVCTTELFPSLTKNRITLGQESSFIVVFNYLSDAGILEYSP